MSEEVNDAVTPKPGGPEQTAPRRGLRVRKRWIFLSIFTALVSLVVVILMLGLMAVMGRSVALPDWVTAEVETRINSQLGEQAISLAGVSVGLLDDELRPTVDLHGLRIQQAADTPMMALPQLRAKLDTSELLLGRVALETLEVSNARLNMVRELNGEFRFAFSDGLQTGEFQGGGPAELLAAVDAAFGSEALRELEDIRAQGIQLSLDDRRSDSLISIEDGRMELVNDANFIGLKLSFGLAMDGGPPTTLILSAEKGKGASGGRLRAEFTNLQARDIAAQFATLNVLDLLDAPASGALVTEFGPEGELISFAGALDIGAGVVQPAPQAKPLPLNSAKASVRYSAATERLHLDALEIDAPELKLAGEGHADLLDLDAGIPQTLLMQIRLRDLRLDPEGIFESPVQFSEGLLDLRYKPTELKATLGQMLLRDQAGTEILASGNVSVEELGYRVALDAEIGEIAQDKLLALWPSSAKENTRDWLTTNIRAGLLQNAAAALRLQPGENLMSAVTFDFEDAEVRYMKTLPPVTGGHGHFSILGRELSLYITDGVVVAPGGAALDVAGSVLQIGDMTNAPVIAEVDLRATGPLSGAMALLDQKPFEFLSKAGVGANVADGRAVVEARLTVPLLKDVQVKDVTFDVDATLRDVRSDRLVEGRKLRSERMRLTARDGRLTIAGAGSLDGVPIDVSWSRAIGPGSADTSNIRGTIELSQRALEAFNIGLPPGSVSGKGVGQVELSLAKGRAPELQLRSDLRGIGLEIEALGWGKAQSRAGKLEVDVTVGPQPKINGFSISAPGLSAKGDISLNPGGGLNKAVFSPLRVDGRLNSRVEVIGRGAGRPVAFAVRGGEIDIRKFGVGQGGATGRARGGPPLDLALDSLRVTDQIVLQGFRGKFRNERGLDGTFTGRVNGQADVSGTIVPTANGLAVRIASANGGAVLGATGIFRNARGGEMQLVLQPNGKPGQFEGQLKIDGARVKKAPALADLLAALSVVGLLEQLSGDGITFDTVEARFLLSPNGVTLRSSSAVGPSMGITMEGVYNTQTRRMAMQGVVSPIYLVNRPLGFLFAKKGEGLFGFNYGLNGSADSPQVTVNPLSVFTPGIFREIFRRPPPQLQN